MMTFKSTAALGLAALCLTVSIDGNLVHRAQAEEASKVPGATGYSDAQTAKILKTANEGEIEAGKLALKHAQNADVKAFAKKMVDEHQENLKTEKGVAQKAAIKFDDSPKSKEVAKDAKDKIASLKDQKKEAFDKAYMTTQVEMHQGLLDELDTKLIPGTRDASLKSYLEKTRDHVKMHLEEAKKINDGMKM